MYNRLFTKILDSSIWLEEDVTRIVWITFLAAMDEDGFCAFSCNENLSRRANVPLDRLEEALKVLESPDKHNPNDEFKGRRIERVANGWIVLKAPVYRTMMSREIQREQTRVRVAEWRAKQANVTNGQLPNVTVTPQSIAKHSKADQNKAKQKDGGKLNLPNGLIDSEWIARLKENKAYDGIDIDREQGKMIAWCEINRKNPTRRRFVNWLNRADKPLSRPKKPKSTPPKPSEPIPEWTPEQIVENKRKIAEIKRSVFTNAPGEIRS